MQVVTVNDKQAAAVRQTMDRMVLDRDVAIDTVKFADQFVVVAWNVNDAGAFARFPKNLLNNVVMLLRPINTAPQLPDVDQVPHHIESFEFVLAQEIQQCARVRATRPEMHVRNPGRSHATDETWFGPKRSLNGKSSCA